LQANIDETRKMLLHPSCEIKLGHSSALSSPAVVGSADGRFVEYWTGTSAG
jgi:hypothetical protein